MSVVAVAEIIIIKSTQLTQVSAAYSIG